MDIIPNLGRDENAAYEAGAKAHASGQPIDANPYDLGSGLFGKWSMGWENADAAAALIANAALAGKTAHAAGLPRSANPFEIEGPLSDSWEAAWDKAAADEIPE